MRYFFTLTELLVVISIIVILAGILLGGMGFAGRRADEARTQAAIQVLSAALEQHRSDKGYYPPCVNADDVKLKRDSGKLKFEVNSKDYDFFNKNSGKDYMEVDDLDYYDAWEKPLRYQCPGTHNKSSFDLWSCGPDTQNGTEDDITNWDTAQ